VDGWGGEPVVDIPLTFGMEGAVPPGGRPGAGGGFGGGFGGPFGGGGPGWWRPGGYFSRPLLANPHFRKVFLKRVRDILDRVYTEETYAPMIDELAERLKEDAALRAQARGDNADAAAEMMADNVRFLKTHLRKRREYLLGQDELRRGAGDDR
jgi:hypothetical protein